MVTPEAREIFSETVIDHAINPRNVGEIQNADGRAVVTGSCGDTMGIWLGQHSYGDGKGKEYR
jgi:NifU-like protein involved in Fe-S cluster formation